MDITERYTGHQIEVAKAQIRDAGLGEVCPYSTPRAFLEAHSKALWLLKGDWEEYSQSGEVSAPLGDLFPA